MADQEALTLRNRIVGVLLRDARERAERTKRECAQVLGVSTGKITAYEEGRKPISLPELEVLAYFLEVPIAHFWESDPELGEPEELPPVAEVMLLRHRIIGALLRQARLDAGKTQKELAEVLGCSAGRITAYEYGQRPLPLAELEVLARHLHVPLEYFLDERGGPIGEWEQGQEMTRRFCELPPDVRAFVAQPINLSYLRVAMRLSEASATRLREIAEGLLDITL